MERGMIEKFKKDSRQKYIKRDELFGMCYYDLELALEYKLNLALLEANPHIITCRDDRIWQSEENTDENIFLSGTICWNLYSNENIVDNIFTVSGRISVDFEQFPLIISMNLVYRIVDEDVEILADKSTLTIHRYGYPGMLGRLSEPIDLDMYFDAKNDLLDKMKEENYEDTLKYYKSFG
jgi:hypothetical protein